MKNSMSCLYSEIYVHCTIRIELEIEFTTNDVWDNFDSLDDMYIFAEKELKLKNIYTYIIHIALQDK